MDSPTKQDVAAVRRLRRYYSREFSAGESDEAFIVWVETVLRSGAYTATTAANRLHVWSQAKAEATR